MAAAIDRTAVLEAAARLVERRRYDLAIAEYRKLIALNPRDARTWLKIGDIECRRSAYADAIDAYVRAGEAYSAQGHAAKMIATFTRVRELIATRAPHLEELYSRLPFAIVDAYCELGLTSDAMVVLGDLAADLSRRGREAEAIAVLRKGTEIDPEHPSPRLRLAEALSRFGDTLGAVAELGVAASRLVAMGRTEDALIVIERLLHHDPDPSFARLAAELYLARGSREDATLALRKLQICVRADEKDLDALRLLAQAFGALGHVEKVDEVQREIAEIVGARGIPPLPPAEPAPEPPSDDASSDEDMRKTTERSTVQVIPVSPESWKAIASRLQAVGGEGEQVLAFVCAPENDERATMRTIYGVVKILFD
jgi:tetratricopeptide (TPR) repeat protein